MSLHSATPDELRAELARREAAAAIPIPTPLTHPDFTALIQVVTDGVAETIKNSYQDSDLAGYVWEAAVEAVYGPSYWTWRQAQRW